MEEKDKPEAEPLTAVKIARWMNSIVEKKGELKQKTVTFNLVYKATGGRKFVHKNNNGNWAINEDVLEEFNKLNAETVVWSFSKRLWRKRRKNDPAGRMVR